MDATQALAWSTAKNKKVLSCWIHHLLVDDVVWSDGHDPDLGAKHLLNSGDVFTFVASRFCKQFFFRTGLCTSQCTVMRLPLQQVHQHTSHSSSVTRVCCAVDASRIPTRGPVQTSEKEKEKKRRAGVLPRHTPVCSFMDDI